MSGVVGEISSKPGRRTGNALIRKGTELSRVKRTPNGKGKKSLNMEPKAAFLGGKIGKIKREFGNLEIGNCGGSKKLVCIMYARTRTDLIGGNVEPQVFRGAESGIPELDLRLVMLLL